MSQDNYETVLQTNADKCTCTFCLVNSEGILAEKKASWGMIHILQGV